MAYAGSIKALEELNIDIIDPDEDEYENLLFGKKRKVLLQDMDLMF